MSLPQRSVTAAMTRLVSPPALASLRLPRRLLRAVAGKPRESGDGRTLDLQTQAMLRMLEIGHFPSFERLGVHRARDSMRLISSLLDFRVPRTAGWHDRIIPGPAGDLPARIYTPTPRKKILPGLVYFHGGGFVLGSLESHHGLCWHLANTVPCTVVAVAYRLAPEHPFPAAVDDALAAFRWIGSHASELDLRADRLAVAGDSAGGNLTTVVSMLTRNDPVRPVFQLPIYPAVDLTCSFPSHARFADGFFLTRSMIGWFLGHYLARSEDVRDVRASPWFADDVRNMPPALVITAGFDPLRDEGMAWVRRLTDAGNEVQSMCCDGLIHGFASTGLGIAAAGEALGKACGALRSRLHA